MKRFLILVSVVVALCLAPTLASATTNLAADLVAFVRSADYNPHIWTMWGDGSHLRQVTAGFYELEPALSPNGRYLAYCSYKQGREEHIRVKDLLTGYDTAITQGIGMDWSPTWSPDGQWLAYSHWNPDTDFTTKIMIARITINPLWGRPIRMSAPRRLTNSPYWVYEGYPAWGPDGLIAYECYEDSCGIWIADTKSGIRREFIGIPEYRFLQPSWSPDGHWLAFAASGGMSTSINIAPIAKEDTKDIGSPIFELPNDWCGYPKSSWSRTTGWIYFDAVISGFVSGNDDTAVICAVDPNGGEVKQILSSQEDYLGHPSVSRNPFYHK